MRNVELDAVLGQLRRFVRVEPNGWESGQALDDVKALQVEPGAHVVEPAISGMPPVFT